MSPISGVGTPTRHLGPHVGVHGHTPSNKAATPTVVTASVWGKSADEMDEMRHEQETYEYMCHLEEARQVLNYDRKKVNSKKIVRVFIFWRIFY